MKTLGVLKDPRALETRVILIPEVAKELKNLGYTVLIEEGAGVLAGYSDEDYQLCGAQIIKERKDLLLASDIILTLEVSSLSEEKIGNKVLIGLCEPFIKKAEMNKLKEQGATVLSLEFIPRTSRAQSMDVLSSQANIAGYVAVLMAAQKLNKVIPLMMTAAGTIRPAEILVVGAGVAGLQAIATAKRLGAQVYGYDVRSAVKEQIESLGAKFVAIAIDESGEGQGGYAKALSEDAMKEQRAKLTDFAKNMDVIITTAQIPGKKAPRLLDDSIFLAMKDGSVIIDMAAKSGGNVANAIANEWQKIEGVWLYGADELARVIPKDSSFTLSKNIKSLISLLGEKELLDMDDEILKEALISSGNQWVNPKFKAYIES